ncbi:unnamed protein product [Cyprideis torosa]|uniref:Uncharacterized protein n=1 Tax=Cyprideis torosa TaxID=163714 RepID=A0A7R8WD65_9CRUS|nr:unnamed protein product [Cyprideis torosa]CAG0894315.1 unnamed protein product [Cyprideis torosa]
MVCTGMRFTERTHRQAQYEPPGIEEADVGVRVQIKGADVDCVVPMVCTVMRFTERTHKQAQYKPPGIKEADVGVRIKGADVDCVDPQWETLQSGNTIKPGAPGSPHQRFHRPTSTAVDESLLALRSIEASRSLQKEFDLSTRQAGLGLSKFEAAGQLTVVCPKRPQCVTPRRGGFRTIDGSCNNPLDTIFGRSNTQAQRILPAAYDDGRCLVDIPESDILGDITESDILGGISESDILGDITESDILGGISESDILGDITESDILGGISESDILGIFAPRTRSSAGRTLPSARAVSAEVFKSDERVAEDQKTTAGFVQWGQFVDHDLTLGAIFTLDAEGTGHQCCTEDGRAIRNAEFPCFPIEIATDDPFYSPFRQRCMNFVRGRPAPRLDCKLGYAEQINQLTAWLDASMVYGSDDTEAAALRAFRGGQMRIQGRGQKSLLPLNPREDEVFRAGDGRVNEWIGLTAMHTIFVREHNRLAAELEQLNRDWDDERIYQETRKIVGAIVQHITYNEFLPLSLGYRYLRNFGLLPLRSGFKRNYDPKIKPQITNEFATAAFRYGHTKMPGTWKLFFSESGRPREIQVSPFLENPQIIFQNQAVDALMRAFSRVPAAGTDGAFTTEVRQVTQAHL